MGTGGWGQGSWRVGWGPEQSTSAAGRDSPSEVPGLLQQLLLPPGAEDAGQGLEQGGCPHAVPLVGPVPWVWLKAEGAVGEDAESHQDVGIVGGWGQKLKSKTEAN